ncbi:MAG: T9SS type A sorting domain-containing protein, partial [Bacteroidetes bacterium]|nr:T9SS type A sorting domain-containing protein [Bacteroidota bacterium]
AAVEGSVLVTVEERTTAGGLGPDSAFYFLDRVSYEKQSTCSDNKHTAVIVVDSGQVLNTGLRCTNKAIFDAVDEFNQHKSIALYPNPSFLKEQLTLSFDGFASGVLKIHSTIGQLVYKVSFKYQNELNFRLANQGIYFLEVNTDEGERIVSKIVVSK